MKIKIIYDNDQYIIIKMIVNDTIEKWFNFCKTKNYTSQQVYLCPKIPNYKSISENWEQINQCLDIIKSWKINVPLTIPINFDYNQSLLNSLHNFFTYNLNWLYTGDSPNKYNPNFVFLNEEHCKQWDKIFHNLNDAIHKLESNIINSHHMHVVSLLKRRLSNLHIITSTDSFITFNENDYKLNYGFLNLNYDIPVFLDDSILGKSIFESFLQHDDPRQDDCTGRKISFGGFYIDVFNDRKKIYKSKIFKKWTEQYNLNENLPYEFTIGYVETFSDNIINNYFFKNIKEVLWLQ